MGKRIKVDGRILTVPDDATPEEIDQLSGGGSGSTGSEPVSGAGRTPEQLEEIYSAAGSRSPATGAAGLKETPWYRQHAFDVLPSAEQAAEFLPAAGASVATMLGTKNPTAAAGAGSAAGEVARQLFRHMIGVSQAPGVAQEALGLDPESPEAAASGVLAETLTGGAADKITRALLPAVKAAESSGKRDIAKLMAPKTDVEKSEALRLAEVARRGGMVPAGSSRRDQTALVLQRLREAQRAQRAIERQGIASGKMVDPEGVIQSALDEIPPNLPGGATPRTGTAQRTAAENVADDVVDAVAGSAQKGGDVPLEAAISERRRMDDLLDRLYESGKVVPAEGTKAVKASADAWRRAISESYPELGAANLKVHDLLMVKKMMKRALAEAERTGAVSGEAGAVGAAAAGRMSIPFMKTAEAIANSGQFRTLSAGGKRLLARLIQGGARTSQLWARVPSLLNDFPDAEETIETEEEE